MNLDELDASMARASPKSKQPSERKKSELPSPPLTGRCQCSKIQYSITSRPIALHACYCLECQWQSGSTNGLSLVVPSSGVQLSAPRMQKSLKHWKRKADSGKERGAWFCSDCGTRLWHYGLEDHSWATIKAGTLDEKVNMGAAVHIWTKRKPRGVVIPEGAEQYDEEPPDRKQ